MFEMKMDPDAKGRVLLRDGVRRGRWGRPVVDSKGGFYASITEASVAAGVHQSAMSRAVSEGQEIEGVIYSDALPHEVSRHVRVKEFIGEQKDKGVLVEKSEEPQVAVKPAPMAAPSDPVWKAKTAAPKPAPTTFRGVVWPDGVVTVRLIPGDFVFTRKSVDELPAEIRAATIWIGDGP